MNMNKAAFGAQKERVIKLLPDDMDPEAVKEFFANTKQPFPALDRALDKAQADLSELARPFMPEGEAAPAEDDPDTEDAAARPDWKTNGPRNNEDDGGSAPVKGKGRLKKETEPDQEPDDGTQSEPTPDTSGEDPTPAPEEETTPDPEPAPEEETASDPEPAPEEETASDPEPAPEEETASDPEPAPEEETGSDTSGSDNYVTDAADHVTGLTSASEFNISIEFVGEWTESQKLAFIEGAETVSDYVVGDLPDEDGIDDLHIKVISKETSGWAFGGPRSVRDDSGLTKTGEVTFNSANLSTAEQYGVIDDFAFHEILHAMGFGTTWGDGTVVEEIGGETRFTGENAIEAYNDTDGAYANVAAGDAYSDTGVPLDSNGTHLNEGFFGSEVMTPTLSTNNVISDLSIAMLEDIGYDTTYGDEEETEEENLDLLV